MRNLFILSLIGLTAACAEVDDPQVQIFHLQDSAGEAVSVVIENGELKWQQTSDKAPQAFLDGVFDEDTIGGANQSGSGFSASTGASITFDASTAPRFSPPNGRWSYSYSAATGISISFDGSVISGGCSLNELCDIAAELGATAVDVSTCHAHVYTAIPSEYQPLVCLVINWYKYFKQAGYYDGGFEWENEEDDWNNSWNNWNWDGQDTWEWDEEGW